MMELPERACGLIDALRFFVAADAMCWFRDAAQARFGADELDDPESGGEFDDYVLWSFRDRDDRSAIDHFLAGPGATLGPAERGAIERFAGSEFGIFRVEAAVPGTHVILRRFGAEEELTVVDASTSLSVGAGSALIARLLPYRDGHEFGSPSLEYDPQAAYALERSLTSMGPGPLEALCDPLAVYQVLRRVRRRALAPPAENRLEAELLAGEAFRDAGLTLSVAEVQDRFQSAESPLRFLDELALPEFGSEREFRSFVGALVGLWNHTPRVEFRGKTPSEMAGHDAAARTGGLSPALAEDLTRTLASKVSPEAYPDEAARQVAARAVHDEWLDTPQRELGGRTPRAVLRFGEVPPLPPESALPAPDLPCHSPQSLEQRFERVSSRPRAAIWALERAVQYRWTELLDADLLGRTVTALLDTGRDVATVAAVCAALRDGTAELRARFVDEVREALVRFASGAELAAAGSHVNWLGWVADFLAKTCPDDHADLLCDLAEHRQLVIRLSVTKAMELFARRGVARARAALEKGIECREDFESLVALRSILRSREPELVERTLGRYFERGPLRDRLSDLRDGLSAIGVSRSLVGQSTRALFPRGGIDGEPDLDDRLGLLLPRSDPIAARRGRELLPPESGREFLRDIDAGKLRRSVERLFELTASALESVPEDRFANETAAALLAVHRALAATGWRRGQPGHDDLLRGLLATLSAIFAWAIRGRDVEREWEDVSSDADNPVADREALRERVVSLCHVDIDWLDPRFLELAATLLDVDQVVALAKSSDAFVSCRAVAVVAVQVPEDFLDAALERAVSFTDRVHIGVAVAFRHRDRILPPLVDWARRGYAGDSEARLECPDVLIETASKLGSQRAAVIARRVFESAYFHGGDPPAVQVAMKPILALGDPELLAFALERLDAGAFDLEDAADYPVEFEESLALVATAFELLERDDDPRAFLEAAVSRFLERKSRSAERDGRGDRPRAVGRDGAPRRDETDAASRTRELYGRPGVEDAPAFESFATTAGEPIRRESPKVGRNDPCPCGSGRKYKKCCGRS